VLISVIHSRPVASTTRLPHHQVRSQGQPHRTGGALSGQPLQHQGHGLLAYLPPGPHHAGKSGPHQIADTSVIKAQHGHVFRNAQAVVQHRLLRPPRPHSRYPFAFIASKRRWASWA
jgi:hypothetical protein